MNEAVSKYPDKTDDNYELNSDTAGGKTAI